MLTTGAEHVKASGHCHACLLVSPENAGSNSFLWPILFMPLDGAMTQSHPLFGIPCRL